MTTSASGPWGAKPPEQLEKRIVIERDGTVVARSGKVEYGQGIRTGFAKIVAAELGVPLERVRVELGETDRVPWDMGTFGSLSTATDGKILRAAAACARRLLLERASARLGVPASELKILDGRIVSRNPARRDQLTYQELTEDEPLTGVIPEDASVFPAGPAKDTPPRRLEALDIVMGRARYTADLRLPGMLRGHVLHPPAPGARLVALNDQSAAALPGVVAVFREEDFVGVVAERDEQALAAVQALEAQWSAPQPAPAEPFHSVLRRDDGVEAILAASPGLRAHYHVPHISHASIGPSAAVADVREDAADLYVAVQRPFGLRDEAAKLLGFAPERVRVHPQAMSGMYGRGNMADAPMDAVRLSRGARRPVLVQWTREEEFHWSPHRPILEADLEAVLDSTGALVGWRYHTRTNPHTYGGAGGPPRIMEMTSGRNAVLPYRVGKAEVLLEVVPGAVRTGAFRSLSAAPNVFAIESFMDELARTSNQDPIAFRLRHADDPRLRRVLEAVRERSGWAQRPRQEGRGFGVACAIYIGTYVAEVAEVEVKPDGQVCLERVWCAADPGRLVQPDGARNQLEGGIQQAASWTLLEALALHNGEVITSSWRDYPIATFQDAPREIDVVFTSQQDAPSSGVGEPGSVPTAAAIANAVFDASGARVRRLPLTPANVLAARPQ